jgi:hypothetical protein
MSEEEAGGRVLEDPTLLNPRLHEPCRIVVAQDGFIIERSIKYVLLPGWEGRLDGTIEVVSGFETPDNAIQQALFDSRIHPLDQTVDSP